MHGRVGLTRAGQVHPAVFDDPVDAAGGGGLTGIPRGNIVHRRARPRRQRSDTSMREPGAPDDWCGGLRGPGDWPGPGS